VKTLIALAAALALAGCVSMAKVERGDRAVGERLQVAIEGPWNHLSAPDLGPAENLDHGGPAGRSPAAVFGLKDGQLIHAADNRGAGSKTFAFKSSMQPDEIVGLFEGMFTRDGSRFRLTRLEPTEFAGQKGFRFEYALTRKYDNVRLSGLGYGTVSNGELFAIVYMAPRLTFFARHRAGSSRSRGARGSSRRTAARPAR